jgi:hypothetical protein
LFKTIRKDKRTKGLYYISNISNKDYYYYNINKANKSEVDEHALNKDIKTVKIVEWALIDSI